MATDIHSPGASWEAETHRAWTDADVCAYLNISVRQLAAQLDEPGFPEPQRLAGRAGRRWAPDAIPNWVASPERERLNRSERVGKRGVDVRL